MSDTKSPLPREVADAYVDDLIALDPVTGTYLGVKESSGKLPDTSPAGQEARAELIRTTLARLDEATAQYRRAIELQARLLAKHLTGEIESYIPFTTR